MYSRCRSQSKYRAGVTFFFSSSVWWLGTYCWEMFSSTMGNRRISISWHCFVWRVMNLYDTMITCVHIQREWRPRTKGSGFSWTCWLTNKTDRWKMQGVDFTTGVMAQRSLSQGHRISAHLLLVKKGGILIASPSCSTFNVQTAVGHRLLRQM
jgi:hypothetical protein